MVLAAVLGPLVIWATAFGLAAAASSAEVAEGQCEGIGFGCSLAPRDGALFVGVLLGVPVVGVATLLMTVSLLVPHRHRPRLVGGLLGVFAIGSAIAAGSLAWNPTP